MAGLLPSALPESIADEEDLARVLRSSGHYSSHGVEAAAFLPGKDGMTSVSRHGATPRAELWEAAEAVSGSPVRHGVAIFKCGSVRAERLDVVSDEPPPRHANVIGWPLNPDPELQKAQQKEIALAIASQSVLVMV